MKIDADSQVFTSCPDVHRTLSISGYLCEWGSLVNVKQWRSQPTGLALARRIGLKTRPEIALTRVENGHNLDASHGHAGGCFLVGGSHSDTSIT
ncbi:hypothetical protein AKJ16_DCAP18864 [Drosera capensis]